MSSTLILEVLSMSPYYKYKKEKFLDKYKCATDTLEDLKLSLGEYRKTNRRVRLFSDYVFGYIFRE